MATWDPQYDLNGDGVIDQADVDLITAHFNCRTGDACYVAAYDFNGDGVISLPDIVALEAHFGATAPGVTPPVGGLPMPVMLAIGAGLVAVVVVGYKGRMTH